MTWKSVRLSLPEALAGDRVGRLILHYNFERLLPPPYELSIHSFTYLLIPFCICSITMCLDKCLITCWTLSLVLEMDHWARHISFLWELMYYEGRHYLIVVWPALHFIKRIYSDLYLLVGWCEKYCVITIRKSKMCIIITTINILYLFPRLCWCYLVNKQIWWCHSIFW